MTAPTPPISSASSSSSTVPTTPPSPGSAGANGSPRPRVCFVTTRPAWPLYPGYRLRTANLLRALTTMADVEAVFILPSDDLSNPLPPDLAGMKVHVVPVPRLSVPKALFAWATSKRPMPMLKVDWAAATPTVAALTDPSRCDVAFVTPSTTWDTVRQVRVPVIADLDDLDDFKILHRLSEPANYTAGWRGRAEQLMDRREVQRWKHLYAEMGERVRCLVVCSEVDRARLQTPNVRALPNVYPVPEKAAQTDLAHQAPQTDRSHQAAGNAGPTRERRQFFSSAI